MMVSVFSLTLVSGERLSLVTGERLAEVVTPRSRQSGKLFALAGCVATWVMAAVVAAPLAAYRFFVVRWRCGGRVCLSSCGSLL